MNIHLEGTSTGALRRLDVDGLSLVQYPATEFEAGPANLWLRVDGTARPLTGPASGSTVESHGTTAVVRGSRDGIDHAVWFDTNAGAGLLGWHWRLANHTDQAVEVDLACTLDVALTPFEDLRRSEFYVSQYLDLSPLSWSGGTALAVRQNMPGARQPWCALASSEPVAAWCTDALQLVDRTAMPGLRLDDGLPGERLQHEHTLAGLQTEPLSLAAGSVREGVFWILVLADHPLATGPQDAAVIEQAVRAARVEAPVLDALDEQRLDTRSVFSPAVHAEVAELAPGEGLDFVEHGPDGAFWSAFRGDQLVVAAAKERQVLRPHGQILHFAPDAGSNSDHLADTVWMRGCFGSQLTLGPASAGERLTIRRSYIGLVEAAGIRLLARRAGGAWQLLDLPSLWEAGTTAARWTYALAGTLAGSTVVVDVELPSNHAMALRAHVEGEPLDLLLAIFEAHEGLELRASAPLGDDSALFADGRSRGTGARTIVATEGSVELTATLGAGTPAEQGHEWRVPQLSGGGEAHLLGRFLRNLAQDAAVHYQTPRGLEQYTGGAWGTRDVCQGPVGLLLATGELDALREMLVKVFAGQQDDGAWPQWFFFLPEAAGPGHRDCHGDVVYWPLLALGEYLVRTGDASILDERAAVVGADEMLPAQSLRWHVEQAVAYIAAHRTSDPRLPAYGHGDWNDSLQPARPELAEQMCSTWTTELEVQSFETLAGALVDAWPEMAERLQQSARLTREAFEQVLLADGELAGYAVLGQDAPELLVHPRDARTGLRHGVLQMIHAISAELLSPEDAAHHLDLVAEHLDGPMGVYLFDTPVAYSGGQMRDFKRAEAATFWGREIGLMYTHAHLRHVEALTHVGRAQEAWRQLCKVVPIGVSERVPGAAPRQLNCYYSSADAAFRDRYEASERAADLFDANTRFEGGWRVYSSGPGLVLRIVTEKLLGIRPRHDGLVIDPVLPVEFDQTTATVNLGDRQSRVTFHVQGAGHGVERVLVGGQQVASSPVESRYRPGGRFIAWSELPKGELDIEVWLGGAA